MYSFLMDHLHKKQYLQYLKKFATSMTVVGDEGSRSGRSTPSGLADDMSTRQLSMRNSRIGAWSSSRLTRLLP